MERRNRVWLIARHHFLQTVTKRNFLFVVFSLPLFLSFTIGLGLLLERLSVSESTTVGYVDPAGFLSDVTVDPESGVQMHAYESREAAQAGLEAGAIGGYYVLAEDFASSRQAELVHDEPLPWEAQSAFNQIVTRNLLSEQSQAVVDRALGGSMLTVHALATGRDYAGDGVPPLPDFLPLFAAAIIGFLIMTTSSYLMDVVVTEKENRTMEIVVSSVSAATMMLGKIIGGIGIALLQLVVWLLFFLGAIWLGSSVFEVAWLQNLQPDWRNIALISLVGVPVYLFMAGTMTALGATLVDTQDAQQAGPFYLLVLYIPLYFIGSIGSNPNGPVALALSLFPPTSITTFALRMVFVTVPWWRALLAVLIASAGAVLMAWLAAKSLRMSMLRYGQRTPLRELWRRQPTGQSRQPRLAMGRRTQ